MKEHLNIALYQQDIANSDPQENYKRVGNAFAQMSRLRLNADGCVSADEMRIKDQQKEREPQVDSCCRPDILIVPETFTTGFGNQMAALAEAPEGPTLEFARQMAAQYDALFVGTWTVCEEGRVFNRMHLVRPDGTFTHYDKAHTFRMSSEATQVARGKKRIVLEWRGWKLLPSICYDLRFPVWLRNYPNIQNPLASGSESKVMLDYDVLLLSANWPSSRKEAWNTLLRARAIENLSYVVGANRVGIDGNAIAYSGDSVILDFKGAPLAEAQSNAAQVITATLHKERLQSFRQHWPFFLDADVTELTTTTPYQQSTPDTLK